MKIVIAAAVALALSVLNTFATSQDDAFQKVAHDYFEQYLKVNPEQATELGDHRFDGELTDYSAEARAKDLATQKEFRDKLNAIDGSQLTGANNIDFRILKENIDYEIFRAEELKEPEWNPLVYMQSLANSLYLLVARDFAPAEKRIPSLRQRLEKIPVLRTGDDRTRIRRTRGEDAATENAAPRDLQRHSRSKHSRRKHE